MFIGIDVGGTHTDAVIMVSGRVVKTAKVATTKDDIVSCTRNVLTLLLEGEKTSCIERVCVSSTLGLNALLTGKSDPVALIVVPGPTMMSMEEHKNDPLFALLEGSQDHRGIITEQIHTEQAKEILCSMREKGAKAIAIIAKFSPKNAVLEESLMAIAEDIFPQGTPLVLGSSVSGVLNFPRRVNTAWCRATLTRIGAAFISAIEETMQELGLSCPLAILKADAGAFSASEAAIDSASSMGSGPAAGMLGSMVFSDQKETTLLLDIGGTTTDISLLVRGEPLLESMGTTIHGKKTLIRSLHSHSIAIGGDSVLRLEKGRPIVGPQRLGSSLCLSSTNAHDVSGNELAFPTLLDALNVLELASVGTTAISKKALETLASHPESPEKDAHALAQLFLDYALAKIQKSCDDFVRVVNEKPVYTIQEIRIQHQVSPTQLVVIGTPAPLFAPLLAKQLALPLHIPEHFAYANAIGAALALPSRQAELYADTVLGTMHVPSLGVMQSIHDTYSLDDAKKDLRTLLYRASSTTSEAFSLRIEDIQFTTAESFLMISDQGERGKIIRVVAQLPSGVLKK